MQAEGYVMVIPEADGKRHSSVDTVTSEITGQITTKIYRLENEIASSLIPVLKPLVTPNNVITASDSNNSLVGSTSENYTYFTFIRLGDSV